MATDWNNMARYRFNELFDGMTVAPIDTKSCAEVQRKNRPLFKTGVSEPGRAAAFTRRALKLQKRCHAPWHKLTGTTFSQACPFSCPWRWRRNLCSSTRFPDLWTIADSFVIVI